MSREIDKLESGEPVLSMRNGKVHFEQTQGLLSRLRGEKKANAVQAVDGIDLDIYENDVIALIGESGCGKTTLGKSLIGVQELTEGSLQFRGQDVWETKKGRSNGDRPFEEIRMSLQIIHQDPGSSLNPNRTIKANLTVPLKKRHKDLSAADRKARIFGMLERVGMTPPEDYASRYPHQLSGGEKQRVALIRALLMNPEVILADEAISALDVSLRVEMMELMLALQDEFGTSYIFISHDLTNARYLAKKGKGRIAVMYMGDIVEIGPADQIVNDPQHPYTKALNWASVEMEDIGKQDTDRPLRTIDIPDPANPPSGCKFHTRCPEARELCRQDEPETVEGKAGSQVSCYRVHSSDHKYWDSDSITDEPVEKQTTDD